MDFVSKKQRSQIMACIKCKDTTPEMLIRRRLFSVGWRYRVCDIRFQGKPDIVIPKAKTIIDVRGCFWHGHRCKDSKMPKSNIAFWVEKWSKNIKRDRLNESTWHDSGWNLIVVWECALERKRVIRTLNRICATVASWAEERRLGEIRELPHRIEIPSRVQKITSVWNVCRKDCEPMTNILPANGKRPASLEVCNASE